MMLKFIWQFMLIRTIKSESVITELIKMFKTTAHLNDNKIEFVGPEIEQNLCAGIITIHQQVYITELNKFNMTNPKLLTIRAEPSVYLSVLRNEANCNKSLTYREAVELLTTRPDITYAVI